VVLLSVLQLIVTAYAIPISPILVTQMMEALVPPKRRFLQEPHDIIPEDGIHHGHRREPLKSYIALAGSAL
jgi:hypothetical protein